MSTTQGAANLQAELDKAKATPPAGSKEPEENELTSLSKDHPEVEAALAKRDAKIAELEKRQKEGEAIVRRDHLSKVTEEAATRLKAAMDAGKLSQGAADAALVLLGVEGVERHFLAKDGTTPESESINVRELVGTILDELPDGASLSVEERTRRLAAGGGVVLSKPETGEETSTADEVEKDSDDLVALSRTGRTAEDKE